MQGVWCEERISGSPDANMAADTALFEAMRAARIQHPWVRIYTWDRPSVSFGRLQNEAEVGEVFPDLPRVRRPTGGRAVRHGDDLTISMITRQEWLPQTKTHGVLTSYRQMVSGLLAAFEAVGIAVMLGGAAHPRARDVVDCFASVAECDAVETRTGRKIMGSAQRRQGGVILQQMSIPRAMLPNKNEFLVQARIELSRALGIEEWLFVDTASAV